MTRVVVVTGTDTGVGKTVATAALAATAPGRVLVVKPVQTGIGPDSVELADVDTVAALAGVDALELARLRDPLAPDTAAQREGASLPTVREHVSTIREQLSSYDLVLVEGAGGLLVRLDLDGGTLLDLAVALDAEVVVVTRAGLGTLNHTELTVAALRAAAVEPTGLIIGSWPTDPGLAEDCNRTDLPHGTGVPLLAVIPEGAGALAPEAFRAAAPTWFG
ncbi:dethiobiotin synthase [Nocardioides nitrophenolicus]|uniref:dethiobiotin synthase n=1 Tax=Nocardioides nitrophenolicus TaxID=60489 RepID=UPI001958B883|nr:dethiobiotin synthase [Nocardioides nitrophenolicus]MBM7519481.1 dethiobiotin synthetase [Nocardioides nitrophenolicus]